MRVLLFRSLCSLVLMGLLASVACGRGPSRPATFLPGPPPGVTAHLTRVEAGGRYYIDIVGPVNNPTGKTVTLSVTRPLVAAGWAMASTGAVASHVDVVIDAVPYGARYGVARPDVAAALKDPIYANSGFEFSMPAGRLAKGTHALSVRIVESDGRSFVQSPDIKVVLED